MAAAPQHSSTGCSAAPGVCPGIGQVPHCTSLPRLLVCIVDRTYASEWIELLMFGPALAGSGALLPSRCFQPLARKPRLLPRRAVGFFRRCRLFSNRAAQFQRRVPGKLFNGFKAYALNLSCCGVGECITSAIVAIRSDASTFLRLGVFLRRMRLYARADPVQSPAPDQLRRVRRAACRMVASAAANSSGVVKLDCKGIEQVFSSSLPRFNRVEHHLRQSPKSSFIGVVDAQTVAHPRVSRVTIEYAG